MLPISLTPAAQKQVIQKFKEQLQSMRSDVGEFKINIKLADYIKLPKDKATIILTPLAFKKMRGLVDVFDKELAWHGLVNREGNTFTITDILVYPQTVTGTTVQSDEDKYPLWINERTDDELQHLRFQGHSHVNMAPSPSGVDTNNWDEWLSSLSPEDFYIFTIQNKKGESTWRVFDLKTNAVYENADIEVFVQDSSGEIFFDAKNNKPITDESWATEALKQNVATPAPASNYSTPANSYTGYTATYGSYGNVWRDMYGNDYNTKYHSYPGQYGAAEQTSFNYLGEKEKTKTQEGKERIRV